MKFIIRNCRDDKLKFEVGEAIKFYSGQLMHVNLSRKLTVTINFRAIENGCYAECYPSSIINDKPRKFTININKKTIDPILALSHEMVHVKQYAKRELSICHTMWKARRVSVSLQEDDHYRDRPWEKEAEHLEAHLYGDFKKWFSDEYQTF